MTITRQSEGKQQTGNCVGSFPFFVRPETYTDSSRAGKNSKYTTCLREAVHVDVEWKRNGRHHRIRDYTDFWETGRDYAEDF